MASEYARRDEIAVRSLVRRVIAVAGVAVLVVAFLAASHAMLTGGALVAFAATGAMAIAATGVWAARATSDAFRTQAMESQRLADELSSTDARIDAERRRVLKVMADTIERESGIVMAKLAQQAKARTTGDDVEGLLRQAREGVVRAVRGASGEVERRRWPRLRLSGKAEIEIGGARVTAPIVDVSAGGMRIGSTLAAAIGEPCRVRLPGVGPELPAKLLAVSGSEARLRFDIDDITRAVVNRMLESAAAERAEAA